MPDERPLFTGKPIGIAALSFHTKSPEWYSSPVPFGMGREIESSFVKLKASEILGWWAVYDMPDFDLNTGTYRLRIEKVGA